MTFGRKSGKASKLSEQDYARTTHNAPDSTSMIPVIKDAPPNPRVGAGQMRVVRVSPSSVTRLAFVVSVSLMIVAVVAVALFWIGMSVSGTWARINESVASLLGDDSASFDITDYLGFRQVVGGTLVLAALNVVVLPVLATVGAHLFNLAAAFVGGIKVTVRED